MNKSVGSIAIVRFYDVFVIFLKELKIPSWGTNKKGFILDPFLVLLSIVSIFLMDIHSVIS